MKKSVIALIAALAVVVAGAVACVVAVAFMGLDLSSAFDDGTFTLSNDQQLIPGKIHGFGSEDSTNNITPADKPMEMIDQGLDELKDAVENLGIVSYRPDDYRETVIDDDYADSGEYHIETGRINEIELNWVSGDIDISVGDGESIILRETGGDGREDALRYGYEENTLRIFFCESGRDISFLSKELEIVLPRSLVSRLEEISIDTVSSSLSAELEDFNSSLGFDSVSGSADIRGSIIELDLDSVSGELVFAGSCSSFEADSVSGEVRAEFTGLPRELEADSTSGNVELTFPSGSGFELSYDTVSGDFYCDFGFHQSNESRYSIGNGGNTFRVDTTSGDLTIYEK